jgi:hypothetical protein
MKALALEETTVAVLCGLDLTREVATHFAQEKLLSSLLQLARDVRLPVLVHQVQEPLGMLCRATGNERGTDAIHRTRPKRRSWRTCRRLLRAPWRSSTSAEVRSMWPRTDGSRVRSSSSSRASCVPRTSRGRFVQPSVQKLPNRRCVDLSVDVFRLTCVTVPVTVPEACTCPAV